MDYSLFQELIQSFSHYGLVIGSLEMARRAIGLLFAKIVQIGEVNLSKESLKNNDSLKKR